MLRSFFNNFFKDAKVDIASLVVGNLINWLLHGALTVQLCLGLFLHFFVLVSYQLADFYYVAFPNDRKWIKAAVYTVYILETAQLIGFGAFLIITVSDPDSMSLSPWKKAHEIWLSQMVLLPLVSGSVPTVPLIAQCIYAHRIRIITQRKVMPGLIITLAILQFFAAMATMISVNLFILMMVLMIGAGLNVVNDLIIAFIMVRSLSKNKRLSDYTKLKVVRLIHLVIATGSLTVAANFFSFFSLLPFSLAILKVYPNRSGMIALPVLVFMPKLYANSILVMLNNRMAIRDSRNATPNTSANVVSMLVIADHQTNPSDSVMPHAEVPFSSSATNEVGNLEFTQNHCTSLGSCGATV